MFWGSGGTLCHPQPALAAFADFTFPEDLLDAAGLFKPISQITPANKRNILGGTFARLHGLDLDTLATRIAGDRFSRPAGAPPAAPLSTIDRGQAIETHAQLA